LFIAPEVISCAARVAYDIFGGGVSNSPAT